MTKERLLGLLDRKGFNLPEYVYMNYFWILTIGGLFWIATKQAWLDTTFIPLLIYFLLFTAKGKIKSANIFDILWILSFLWCVFTWFANDYPNQGILIIRCLSEQMAYMMAYWIVRKNERLNVQTMIKASYVPLLITVVLGIILFYTEPSWYASRTKDYATDFEEFEFKRLRSIWMDSYLLMYYCSVVVIYEFFRLAKGASKEKLGHYMVIALCVFSILLGIQRSAIASIGAALVLTFYYVYKYSKFSNIKGILVFVVLLTAVSSVAVLKMEGEQQLFYISKIASITEDGSDLATQRLTLNKKQGGFQMIGDGVGRHNMYADKYNPMTSMRDGEYVKMLQEQGYVGFSIFILLIALSLLKSFYHFKYLAFEFAVIVMLLISMIGANPISTGDKHPLIYWMIIAQIANFSIKKRKYGKIKIVNNYSDV